MTSGRRCHYNHAVRLQHHAVRLRPIFLFSAICVAAWAFLACAWAQEKPKVQLNVMNVCTPNAAEQAELSAALAKLSERPAFGPDFEVARGRTTAPEGVVDWVRLRREYARDPVLTNVQFLLSAGGNRVDEKLVFHARASHTGEPLQISLEHEADGATAAQVLAAETRPNRIRLERFGSPSLVLARCTQVDQSAYEPLFRLAAERFAAYRSALRVRTVVAAELASLPKPAAEARR
jgi:hypothetical protein